MLLDEDMECLLIVAADNNQSSGQVSAEELYGCPTLASKKKKELIRCFREIDMLIHFCYIYVRIVQKKN